jgi:hypothetical protein
MIIDKEFARRDDCLSAMVPSDLRVLIAERDAALAKVEELEVKLLDRKQDPVIIGASRVGKIACCKACNGTGRRPIGGRGQIFGLTNRCLECQPMTEEECQ